MSTDSIGFSVIFGGPFSWVVQLMDLNDNTYSTSVVAQEIGQCVESSKDPSPFVCVTIYFSCSDRCCTDFDRNTYFLGKLF